MNKVLVMFLMAIFVFSFGFVTQAAAEQRNRVTTQTRYDSYLSTQKNITKLQAKLTGTTDSTKAAKLQKRINKLTTKADNIKPVVRGLNSYVKNTAKLEKLETKLETGGLSESQVAKVNKQITTVGKAAVANKLKASRNEIKQYDKLGTRIKKFENKLKNDGLTKKQEIRIQNKVSYLSGEAKWLQDKTNSVLGD